MTNKNQISNDEVALPLTVTVAKACELSGFGPTSIWSFLKTGRLKVVRVPGIRRTLIDYGSLAQLVTPSAAPPPSRRRGRPPKPRAAYSAAAP